MKYMPFNKAKDSTTKPKDSSISKRNLPIYAMLSFGWGALLLSGYAISSFGTTRCDGTVNFKANTSGAEFVYSKTNCYQAQPQQQQASK